MKIETLRDVLEFTQKYHHALSESMQQCEKESEQARSKLLLSYLSEHEQKLSDTIKHYEEDASLNALNTWCYDYLDKQPIVPSAQCDQPFSEWSTEEIIVEVERIHSEIINLYKHLQDLVGTPSAVELIKGPVNLEEHEAMRMAHSTNRLIDL